MNCWPSGKYVNLLYMYSILGRGSFCFNYCLNSAWHGGDQFVALLRWYGSPGFFDSGLQLICIFLVSCFSFSSWQYPIDSGYCFQDGWVCWPVKHTNLTVGHLTNFWCFWQCGQVPNPVNFLLTCLDTALCEQSAPLAMNVCGLPSLWRVSMIVFWTTVGSAVFPCDCVA